MSSHDLLDQLRYILGEKNVLTGENQTEHYRTGFRSGEGSALAVVFPTTLLEQWKVLDT